MAGDGEARGLGEDSVYRQVVALFLDLMSQVIADKNLGLSNFNMLKTKRVLQVARIIPAVNQVEIHP